MTLPNGDKLTYEEYTNRVTVERKNGRTYIICNDETAHWTHRRGAHVLGDLPNFSLPKRTISHILKFFYPHDSLRYLEKFGYIAH